MELGLQDRCRYCDEVIYFGTDYDPYEKPDGTSERMGWPSKGWWGQVGTEDRTRICTQTTEDARVVHQPKLHCNYEKGNMETCLRKIKPQDIMAGHFACGTHMRFELEKEERIRRTAEHEEAKLERQATLEWKASLYGEAWTKLRALFLDHVEIDIDMGDTDRGPVEKGYGSDRDKIYRVRENMKVDILALAEFLEERGVL